MRYRCFSTYVYKALTYVSIFVRYKDKKNNQLTELVPIESY